MSEATVLARPVEDHGMAWIELDEYIEEYPTVGDAGPETDFIELDTAVVSFDSQEAMRFGPRGYTPEQAEIIRSATRNRRPLHVAPVPLDDE
jgi:hypothetical protein